MAPIIDKIKENRLRRLRYVLRRGKVEALRVAKGIYFEENRQRGRPKMR